MTLVYTGADTMYLAEGKHYECAHFVGPFVEVSLPNNMRCIACRKDFQLVSEIAE